MKKLFWKTYQVEFVNTQNTKRQVQFFRGFPWEVIKMAVEEAKEKSEKEKEPWAVNDIKRI